MKGQGSLASLGDFPGNVDDLTPEWLTQAFRAHGLDVTVASFVAKQIGTGQVGENNRIVLTYEGEAKGAPKTVVCKFSSRDPQSRATGMNSRNYIKEWRFYTHLAPYLRERGVNVAQCWAAEFDPDRAETILVLEDLAPAEQGDQVHGISVKAAEVVMKQGARMHAAFYNSEDLQNADWLDPPTTKESASQSRQFFQTVLPGWIARYPGRVSAEMEAFLVRFANNFDKWMMDINNAPKMLRHGDFRIDNLLFRSSEDGEVDWSATVDWQTYGVSSGAFDIGYCLGSGLLPEDRRAHEERLFRIWYDELCRGGVNDYSFEDAWNHYRHGHLTGLCMAVLAAMIVGRTERGDEMFWAMASRHYSAIQDLKVEEFFDAYDPR